MKDTKKLEQARGITLIALVVTIVILIILATISINLILNGGLINKTESGVELHRREAAKEKLSMTLASGGLEKKMNPKYNQNDFLDGLILKDISNAKILGDVVVVDGYGFEIDRSVPKIGKYIGKEEELVFPELRLEKEIREDSKIAVIKITTKEEKNGINKIEILQDGFVIETYEYSNVKEEISENYEVSRNGNYVIKVYSALSRTEMIEISELVANIKYSPNGSEEYKKEHIVQVSVDKTVDKVLSIKYQWTNTTEEPEESSFIESCTDGEKITKNEVTGSWYLWTLIETEGGKNRIEKSEVFKFDNEEPQVELTSMPTSETSFTLTATGADEHSEIEKYEFYVGNKLVKTIETNEGTASFEVTDKEMGKYDTYVIVKDKVGNQVKKTLEVRTKMHAWEEHEVIISSSFSTVRDENPFGYLTISSGSVTDDSSYSQAFFHNKGGYFFTHGPLEGYDLETVLSSSTLKYISEELAYATVKVEQWNTTGSSYQVKYAKYYVRIKEERNYSMGEFQKKVYQKDENFYPNDNKKEIDEDGVKKMKWYKYIGIQ